VAIQLQLTNISYHIISKHAKLMTKAEILMKKEQPNTLFTGSAGEGFGFDCQKRIPITK